jgi:N-acetylneuraminic acid mutarotase
LEEATQDKIPKIFTALILPATAEQAHGRASNSVMIPKRKPSQARAFATALVINEKAYIVGGQDKSDCWEYVPGTNTWTEVAPFPGGARGYAAGFAVGKLGYFGTGSASGSGGTDDFWAFDPTAAINDDDNQ